MASVTFDENKFRLMYPALTEENLPRDVLLMMWDQAAMIVGADDRSFAPYNPEKGITEREVLLYYVTCHLATLATQDPSQPGRLASATEGSVSTSFDNITAKSVTAQWWLQTRCGATYWALTAKYRMGGRFYGSKNYHPWG